MDGWISIHRKLLTWKWYTDSYMVHLALHLLLKANHAPRNWKGITITRGQLIAGRRQLTTETGIAEQTIRTCLVRLRKSNFLRTKSTQHFTIITISKYEDYQVLPQPFQPTEQPTTNQQLTNNQPTTNQQLTTNNKYNKENNVNKVVVVEPFQKNENFQKNEIPSQKKADPDFAAIVEAYHQACPTMSPVKLMYETRKRNLSNLLSKASTDQLLEVFRLAGKSDFLNGQNRLGWTADFDWIIKPQNFYKSLKANSTIPKKNEKFKPNDPRASQSAGWGIPL